MVVGVVLEVKLSTREWLVEVVEEILVMVVMEENITPG